MNKNRHRGLHEIKNPYLIWIIENFDKLTNFQPQKGTISEAVNLLKEHFDFNRISSTPAGKRIWSFRGKVEAELENTWASYTRYNIIEVNVWEQNESIRMSIVLSYHKDDAYSKQIRKYLHTSPIPFLEESLKLYSVNSASKKFGL